MHEIEYLIFVSQDIIPRSNIYILRRPSKEGEISTSPSPHERVMSMIAAEPSDHSLPDVWFIGMFVINALTLQVRRAATIDS